MAAAGARLLDHLKRAGPARIEALAEALGLTREAVRQHLARLEADGLVAARAQAGGRGRPARLWALTDRAQPRYPDRHADLARDLLTRIREDLGEAALERLIAEREQVARSTYRAALAGARTLSERVAVLARLRADEGYMADWRQAGPEILLTEHHCPIRAAAEVCRGFCQAELASFAEAAGPGVTVRRVEHALQGGARCVYAFSAASPASRADATSEKPSRARQAAKSRLIRPTRAGPS